MARRNTTKNMPSDPAGVLRALGACRSAMLNVSSEVKPFGPAYHAASMVVSAIDGFATFLTGQRYVFGISGSTPNEHGWGEPKTTSGEDDEPCR